MDAVGWEWADSIDVTALRRMAQVSLELFQAPERWIHRRVEYVSFKNHELAHHQVSVDFTLPSGMPPVGQFDGKDVYIAPLFLLVKDPRQPLREGKPPWRRFVLFGERVTNTRMRVIPTAPYSNVDFTDQNGARVPLITRRQSNQLAATMLREAAAKALGKQAGRLLADKLSEVADSSWAELRATNTLDWLLVEKLTLCCDPRAKLRKSKAFTELVWMLANHYIVACLFVDGATRRSLFKLSYDQRANEDGPVTRAKFAPVKGARRSINTLLRGLGLKSGQYYIPVNEVGGAASYHVEIDVPKELVVNAVGLIGKRYGHYDELRSRSNQDYSIRQIECASEGKIHVPEPLPGRRVGVAWVKFRVRQPGFLIGALIASVIISGALWLTRSVAVPALRNGNAEAAVAALLLIPALMAAYVARPGEHAITAKMLRLARVMLVADAVLPVVAVFYLLTTRTVPHYSGVVGNAFRTTAPIHVEQHTKIAHTPQEIWMTLFYISLGFVVLFAANNLIPIPHGKTIYYPMPKEHRSTSA